MLPLSWSSVESILRMAERTRLVLDRVHEEPTSAVGESAAAAAGEEETTGVGSEEVMGEGRGSRGGDTLSSSAISVSLCTLFTGDVDGTEAMTSRWSCLLVAFNVTGPERTERGGQGGERGEVRGVVGEGEEGEEDEQSSAQLCFFAPVGVVG